MYGMKGPINSMVTERPADIAPRFIWARCWKVVGITPIYEPTNYVFLFARKLTNYLMYLFSLAQSGHRGLNYVYIIRWYLGAGTGACSGTSHRQSGGGWELIHLQRSNTTLISTVQQIKQPCERNEPINNYVSLYLILHIYDIPAIILAGFLFFSHICLCICMC